MSSGRIWAGRRALAAVALLAFSAVTGWAELAAAETLPVTIDRYVDACRKTGAGIGTYTNDGARLVSCKWTSHGKTDCLLENDQVTSCVIACTSTVCLAENPSSANPKWPLNGGPKRLPTVKAPTTGTNAPAN